MITRTRFLPLAFVALGFALCALPTATAAGKPDAAGVEFFEKKVRPLLVSRCYECHAATAKKLRGGLLLDTRAGWTKGGDTGPAIVPGNVDDSLLVQAIRYDDPVLQMPPKGKLPEEEIATLVEWVKRGAPDPRTGAATAPLKPQKTVDLAKGRQFWSFQPLAKPEPPEVHDTSWCRTPVDRFVLAKLEEKGLKPNAAATRRQLIRRAYFDLTGLPPAPEEVEAFVADPAPDAYERLIDRLLASPHYGERWARHWLDLARFAESHGFEHDYDRPTAYHYRDFVIEALNQDLPYDTFVRWQLAGDELVPNDNLALKATGFLAAGTHSTQITANQVEKERYDELDDMANTTGTAFLGLTIGCARCHDHKYDPIPQNDYYRLLSTFTTVVRTEVDLDLDPEGYKKAKDAFDREHEPYAAAVEADKAGPLAMRLAHWEQERKQKGPQPEWVVLDLVKHTSKGGAEFKKQEDGSYLATGKNADFDTYTFVANVDLKQITALRLEALADGSLVKNGPGRAANGNFALSELKLTAQTCDDESAQPVALKVGKLTFEQKGLPASATLDGEKKTAWAVDPEFGKNHAVVFELDKPLHAAAEEDCGCGVTLTVTLEFANNKGHNIGRPRLAVTNAPAPVALEATNITQDALGVLAKPESERTPEDEKSLLAWYSTIDPHAIALRKAVTEHLAKAPKRSLSKALISSEGLPAVRLHTQGADFLEKTHFLRRGDPNQKAGEATQSFLQVLMRAPEQEKRWHADPPKGWRTSYRRASLASWMTDVDQGAGPLLARVIANRLWQHHIGRGIVATPSDFGAQGERPTHPELLDWLAGELVREGWRLKPIHRLIMTSAVYTESAAADPQATSLDPENALCVRHIPARLEAEAVRDAMLAVSGRLDTKMYGPGTLDENQTRRSIYFTVKRSKLVPMMTLFDAPDALQAMAGRPATTVAPQALLLLNSQLARDCAAGFAKRVAPGENGSLTAAVCRAYAIAFGRSPTSAELADAVDFLLEQSTTYNNKPDDSLRAALADFCQALMSSSEFLYVE